MITYFVDIKEQDGDWIVEVPDYPEIITWGENLEHAKEMALEAITLAVTDDIKDGKSARKPDHKKGHAICLPMEVCFPILIRWAREEQKLSLESLAEKVGMQYQNLQRLERLGSNPTLKTVSKIARGLGIHIDMSIA